MYLTIPQVLSGDVLAVVRARLAALTWQDGARTAGAQARHVKDNRQADLASEPGVHVRDVIFKALKSHPVVSAAARPHVFSPLLITQTEVGGQYGPHVDNAIMQDGAFRSDVSFTLFLTDREDYRGGELCLDLPAGIQSLRLDAGDLVLYPSTLIHWVAPVEQGTRHVAVGWIQSQVPDAAERQILFDLETARTDLRNREPVGSPALLMLDKVFSNLLRKWNRLS